MIVESKNACFLHSTYTSEWKDEVLLQLLHYIIDSKLIDKLDVLFVNHVGLPLDTSIYSKLHEKIIIQNHSQDTTLFENCTLRSLHQFAKIHPEYKIFYLHTKGVSHKKNSIYIGGIFSWIHFMLYSLVTNHEQCLSLLDIYDTVGCLYRKKCFHQENPPHYSGNFWWATADYIRSLCVTELKQKYDAEFWLMQNNPLVFNVCDLRHLYEIPYTPDVYKNTVDHSFKEQVIYCKFGDHGLGLCNQLYSLANSLLIGKTFPGFSTILLSDFLCDYNSGSYCLSQIVLDIPKMNKWLASYEVQIVPTSNVHFEINRVEFGLRPHHITDITELVKSTFVHDNVLEIPIGTNLNTICENGDPLPGTLKHVYVTYTLNGHTHETLLDEYIMLKLEPIKLDFKQFSHLPTTCRTNIRHAKNQVDSFHDILNNISFQPRFYEATQHFMESLHASCYNVIHLRIENDAIPFWANINNIDPGLYKSILEQKYIRIIQQHILPDTTTILLSSDQDNAITQYMSDHGYKFHFMDKTQFEGRDVNAILDLIIGQQCNGVFVGNVNPYNGNGSTFSYAILNALRSNTEVKKICIDTDRIFDPEYIL